MLSLEKATELATETLKSHRAQRAAQDAAWAMNMVYNTGPQWGYCAGHMDSLELRSLRRIVDPNRSDVRITLNFVHDHVRKFKSLTNPQQIAASVYTRTSETYARACDVLLERWLTRANAIRRLRDANEARIILGTGIPRRTIRKLSAVQVQPAQGRRPALELRRFAVGVDTAYPWEIVRDPACRTLWPSLDEQIVGQEKPRTVEWIAENLGFRIETDTTMAHLQTYMDEILGAQAGHRLAKANESKQKGVLVSEWCFREPDSPEPWAWHMFAYRDPRRKADELTPIPFGGDYDESGTMRTNKGLHRNPFHGLPWEFLHFDTDVLTAWGRGLPALLMEAQDTYNIGQTWILRCMQEGIGKWVVETSTLNDPAKQLNNDPRRWIEWKRAHPNDGPPIRVPGPQLPQAAGEIVATYPDIARRISGLSGVQQGESPGKRGEAAEAYRIRLEQAESIVDDMRTDDEIALGMFLKGALIDLIRLSTVDDLRELGGVDVPAEQILELKRSDPAAEIDSVALHPASLRPKTQQDVQQMFTDFAKNAIVDPQQAQFEMHQQGRITVNTLMANALDKQQSEIEMMVRGGQYVQPSVGETHGYHILGVRRFIDSVRWHDVPDDRKAMVQQHLVGHMMADQEEQAMQGGGMVPPQQAAGRPSAPATERAMAPAGTAGAAVNV